MSEICTETTVSGKKAAKKQAEGKRNREKIVDEKNGRRIKKPLPLTPEFFCVLNT